MRRRTKARTYTAQAHEYYEHGDLAKALRLCKRAYALDPNDPRILWDYGSVLRESGHENEAIGMFRRLLLRKPMLLLDAADERNEKWVRSLRNDCRLMIGLSYFDLKRYALAEKWLSEYLSQRGPATPGLYKKKYATDTLESIRNSRLIRQLMRSAEWTEAKKLIAAELKKEPADFYWLAQLAYIHYLEDNCKLALATIRKAVELAPTEPLVMWYYALILDGSRQPEKSIELLRKIIGKGAVRIGTIETKEGVRWGRSLTNDCRFEMAVAFLNAGERESAGKWLGLHIKNRRPGLPSVYTRQDIRSLQREIADT